MIKIEDDNNFNHSYIIAWMNQKPNSIHKKPQASATVLGRNHAYTCALKYLQQRPKIPQSLRNARQNMVECVCPHCEYPLPIRTPAADLIST